MVGSQIIKYRLFFGLDKQNNYCLTCLNIIRIENIDWFNNVSNTLLCITKKNTNLYIADLTGQTFYSMWLA